MQRTRLNKQTFVPKSDMPSTKFAQPLLVGITQLQGTNATRPHKVDTSTQSHRYQPEQCGRQKKNQHQQNLTAKNRQKHSTNQTDDDLGHHAQQRSAEYENHSEKTRTAQGIRSDPLGLVVDWVPNLFIQFFSLFPVQHSILHMVYIM